MLSYLHIFSCLLCFLISMSGYYGPDSMSNERSATAFELPFQSGTDAMSTVPEDSSTSERAVSARDLILEKPSRSGGCLHAYEPLDTLFSSTPDGYEPFYISHFGRHGSRFAGSDDDFAVINELMKYSSRNSMVAAESRKVTLSETGEQLLSDLIALKEYSEGKYGQLTEKVPGSTGTSAAECTATILRFFPIPKGNE